MLFDPADFDLDGLSTFASTATERAVEVVGVRRLSGGWSRRTYKLNTKADGEPTTFCIRAEVSSGVLDTDLEAEFDALQAVNSACTAAPAVVGFEGTGEIIGNRFILMEWVPGDAPNPWNPRHRHALRRDEPRRRELASQFLDGVVKIHATAEVIGDRLQHCRRNLMEEVDHWTAIVQSASKHPGPFLAEACHYLKQKVPADNEHVLQHGDLRVGNVLIDEAQITSFLDWEMAQLGDWRVDIGYLLMPYNAGKLLEPLGEPLVAGLLDPDEFLASYEEVTGRAMAREELTYFMLLGTVKMSAILCNGIERYWAGLNEDPRLVWLNVALLGLTSDALGLLDGEVWWR